MIKIHNSEYENQYCSVCKNNDICSYLSNRKKIDDSVEKLKEEISPSSPIRIKVSCTRFESKNVNGCSTTRTC